MKSVKINWKSIVRITAAVTATGTLVIAAMAAKLYIMLSQEMNERLFHHDTIQEIIASSYYTATQYNYMVIVSYVLAVLAVISCVLNFVLYHKLKKARREIGLSKE